MWDKVSPETLIKALADSGYFSLASYDPSYFCSIVEDHLSVGRERALKSLEESGLAKFEYDPNPTIHPRERVDYWRVVLTDRGRDIVESL